MRTESHLSSWRQLERWLDESCRRYLITSYSVGSCVKHTSEVLFFRIRPRYPAKIAYIYNNYRLKLLLEDHYESFRFDWFGDFQVLPKRLQYHITNTFSTLDAYDYEKDFISIKTWAVLQFFYRTWNISNWNEDELGRRNVSETVHRRTEWHF